MNLNQETEQERLEKEEREKRPRLPGELTSLGRSVWKKVNNSLVILYCSERKKRKRLRIYYKRFK